MVESNFDSVLFGVIFNLAYGRTVCLLQPRSCAGEAGERSRLVIHPGQSGIRAESLAKYLPLEGYDCGSFESREKKIRSGLDS
jgi:hypothetical protein